MLPFRAGVAVPFPTNCSKACMLGETAPVGAPNAWKDEDLVVGEWDHLLARVTPLAQTQARCMSGKA